MRVVFHADDVMVEFEEIGDGTVRLNARDSSSRFEMSTTAPLDNYPMLQQFGQVAAAVVAGVKPQLAAAQAKTSA